MATKMDVRTRIARASEVFRKLGIFQDEVGEVVGASQAQVSRVLAGKVQRWTRLSEEICLYAERLEGGGVSKDAVCANDELIEALRATWDGTAAHAKSLASVIRSLALLRR
jgi:predicted transcriptional regulator